MNAKKKAVTKTKSTKHYIVTFDVDDGDPVQVFNSLDKAKEFATALMTRDEDKINSMTGFIDWDADDVKTDTIKVYEAVLIGKPTVQITFTK